MHLTRIAIKHFRSIKKLELDLTAACVLAGPNSCGKSNVLRAIRFAFLEEYLPEKVAANFPVFVNGPAAEISVKIHFSEPSSGLALSTLLPPGEPFTYEVIVKRNGRPRYLLNGASITPATRALMLSALMIVYVPPIRDIAVGGLDPLKGLLAKALKNAKKGQSINTLNASVRAAFVRKGAEVLDKAGSEFGSLGSIGAIGIDAAGVDVSIAVDQLGVNVDLNGLGHVPLAALGTGHQSQVVMNLFGSLGAAFPGQVIYIFEEPDNHLHPTALLAVAEQMRRMVDQGGAQLFVSSHSASFIGAFPITDVVVLDCDNGVTTQRKRSSAVQQRRIHALMARFGLKPIEALLARSVILVEGGTDVSLIRAFSRYALGYAPEQRDILVVPCGGKSQVVELYQDLIELGVQCFVIFDGDAAVAGSPPYLVSTPLSKDAKAELRAALELLQDSLESKKLKKSMNSVIAELENGPPPVPTFMGSPVEKVAKSSGKVNAAALAQIGAAFSKRTRKKWQSLLLPARVWVWSKDPESLVAAVPGADAVINSVAGVAGGAPPLAPGVAVDVIQGWLHNQASEPALHEAVLAEVLGSMSKRKGELWEFISFLRAA